MAKAIVVRSGVYAIKNVIDEKRYVGSSVDMRARFVHHRSSLRRNKHHSVKLQNAWNLHGEDNFVLEILETVEDHSKLKDAEQKWINCYKSFEKGIGYNVSCTAENGNRGVKQTPEFIEKRISPLRGRKKSPEERAKHSAAQKGVKRGPMSDISKARKSESMKRYVRPPEQVAKQTAILLAYQASPEGRAANSARQKGRVPTDEARKNMSEAGKRRWANYDEDDREKALGNLSGGVAASALSRLGTHLPDETKLKISKTHTGMKHSDETKAKMSESAKNRWRKQESTSGRFRCPNQSLPRQSAAECRSRRTGSDRQHHDCVGRAHSD